MANAWALYVGYRSFMGPEYGIPMDRQISRFHTYELHPSTTGFLHVDWPRAKERPLFYVGIYAAIALTTAFVGICSSAAQMTGALRASRKLFRALLVTVVRATFRFHDTTPQGEFYAVDAAGGLLEQYFKENAQQIIVAFPVCSSSPFSTENRFLDNLHTRIDLRNKTTKMWYTFWILAYPSPSRSQMDDARNKRIVAVVPHSDGRDTQEAGRFMRFGFRLHDRRLLQIANNMRPTFILPPKLAFVAPKGSGQQDVIQLF
ncbi:hypothetical protein DFH08DRAFT_814863 [Mycena albidolilacea]|uniref:Uncharacterized protein n=1 Tax=Mycena albidolilacea TaxID=1033008 RepID=A0AAD7EJR2_9AGAR|nr:hypothetical protein DFH08DRAFT_814863 [Mycena albidolilacea]